MPTGFSCEPCAPVSVAHLPDRCGSFATARPGSNGGVKSRVDFPGFPALLEFGRPYLHTWPAPRHCRGPFFHPRDFYVRAAACGCVCAESCGVQHAKSPPASFHRYTERARQRRLHRGCGSGRGRRFYAAARARLDCLPAAARGRAARLDRDRHRLGAPRGVMRLQEFGEEIRVWHQRDANARAQGSGMTSDGKFFMSTGCATCRS